MWFFRQYEIIGFLFFVFISLMVSLFLVFISYLLVKPNPDLNKIQPYECGFKPFVTVSLPFEVHFYRVAILFLLFDVEISFLFPWAVCFTDISILGHLSVFFLIFVLLWGFLFEYVMKVFAW